MKISSLLSEEEKKVLLKQFYDYFKNPYDFEKFLKEYLVKMGLDEVTVTQQSKDGGIDLVAIRNGVGDLSNNDITKYYIQAKRYSYKNTVGAKYVRELRGAIPLGSKGMFITTSKFSDDVYKENEDPKKQSIILVDGIQLIQSCIDNEIGFTYKPIFSKDEMDYFTKGSKENINNFSELTNYIEKTITRNDIRARIISLPSAISKLISGNDKKYRVIINDKDEYDLTYNETRNYFAGVTKIFKEYGLITSEGVLNEKKCKWIFDETNNVIHIYFD